MDQGARELIDHRWAELRRLACVAVDDGARGDELATAAMTDLARSWADVESSGRPTEWLRRRLLSVLPDETATPARGPDGPPVDADPPCAGDDALAREWRGATPLGRAAYLMVELDRWGTDEAATALGWPAHLLRERVHTLHERLSSAHADDLRRPGSEVPWSLEAALAPMVDAVSADAGQDAVAEVERRLRHSRRRRRGLAAVVLVTTLTIGGALWGTGALSAEPSPGPSPARTARPLPTPTPTGLLAAPPRGPLASDPVLISGVSQRFLGEAQVLYAGQDDGRLRVVVIDRRVEQQGPPVITMLTGAADTPVADLEEHRYYLDTPGGGFAVLVDNEASPAVPVLIAPPGTSSVQVSATATVGPGGVVARTWTTVDVPSGVGLLDPRGYQPALLVRVGDQEVVPSAEFFTSADRSWTGCLECDAERSPDGLVAAARRNAAAATGIAQGELAASLVVDSGERPDGLARVVVIRLQLPNGVVLQSTGQILGGPDGPRWDSLWLNDLVPADHLTHPVVAMLWRDDSAPPKTLVAIPPGSPVASIAIVHNGSEGDRQPVSGSVVLDPGGLDPSAERIRSWTADGTLVAEQEFYDQSVWMGPWDLYRHVWPG